MRRFDHTTIFVLIAGTYTRILAARAARHPGRRDPDLGVRGRSPVRCSNWCGSSPRVARRGHVYLDRLDRVVAIPGLVDRSQNLRRRGVGARRHPLRRWWRVFYWRKRPDPMPRIFGYHELFHLLVIAAAWLQYLVVAFWTVWSTRLRGSGGGIRRVPRARAGRIDETEPPCRSGPVRPGNPDQDHVFRVDGQVVSCLRVGEPCKLHDRTTSGIENDPFDVFNVAEDAVPVSGHDDYLRRGGRGRQLALA
jgi:hypothetical protein